MISAVIFLTTPAFSSHSLAVSESNNIRNKFEPWLWNEIEKLETNRTSRMISLIIVLTENSSETSIKNSKASLLIERHGVEDLWIASVLRFLIVKVNSTEVKTIATYDFVEFLGDGELSGEWALDVSTKVVRASHVRRNYGYNGSGVIIAIVDSGINETHPGLAGKPNS